MLDWYRTALASREDRATCISFAIRFLSAPRAEQAAVLEKWDSKLEWALPNPWRLACADEEPGSTVDRIRTDLLFQALGYSEVDSRESIMGFAVVHNSCRLAGLDPRPIFEQIARAVGGVAGSAIRSFASRHPEDQSMEAFMLTAVENPAGGYAIRANW
jgi:hypothetical protein